jgi:hypothetical protein
MERSCKHEEIFLLSASIIHDRSQMHSPGNYSRIQLCEVCLQDSFVIHPSLFACTQEFLQLFVMKGRCNYNEETL